MSISERLTYQKTNREDLLLKTEQSKFANQINIIIQAKNIIVLIILTMF